MPSPTDLPSHVRKIVDEATTFARYNGQRAVFVTVTQRDKQNIFEVRDRVVAAADDFARTLPAGVTLERGFDQSANVGHRLGGLGRDFALAIEHTWALALVNALDQAGVDVALNFRVPAPIVSEAFASLDS